MFCKIFFELLATPQWVAVDSFHQPPIPSNTCKSEVECRKLRFENHGDFYGFSFRTISEYEKTKSRHHTPSGLS